MNWLKRRSLEQVAERLERMERELHSLIASRPRKGQKRPRHWRQAENRITDLRMLVRSSRALLEREGWDRIATATRTSAELTSAS